MRKEVLIVDDSEAVSQDLASGFAAAGFVPRTCRTLAEARVALAESTYAVAILDVLLPDGDGIELLGELRRRPATARLPVLMLSVEAEVHHRVRGITSGADEYISKPYDRSFLVARAVELARLRSDVATPRGPARVLVIDDSETWREELRRAVEEAGYEVLLASTGEEGLNLAAAARPDVAVVDGILPGIDGATFIRRLRMDPALRRTPCLLLTGSEIAGSEVGGLDAGADAYERKSGDLTLVLARIAALLRTASGPTAVPAAGCLSGPKRILAVDDSPTVLHSLAEELRGEGYDLVLAESGEEALRLLAIQRVDCVLLDVMMPGLSGLETCRLIKSQSMAEDPPVVIVLSSRDDRESVVAGLEAGADDYASKAAGFEVLKGRMRALLRRKQFEEENRRLRDDARARVQAQERLRLARDVLELLNSPADPANTIREILLLVKKSTGLEALGIRLGEGAHFPYFETSGFDEVTGGADHFLCERDAAGNLLHGPAGSPVLECTCATVLRGKTDATKPYFTPGGSYWTNSAAGAECVPPEPDAPRPARDHCTAAGYQSVALVPLRSGSETIGLLQLNDRRPDRFTSEMIFFFEGLGSSIGIALSRKRAEDLQRDTLAKLRTTFDGVIHTIMRAVEIRDPYTAGHQRRVADLAHAIGGELGLTGDQLDAILFAGQIHDIGKIAVPAEILAKPGKLSAMEFSLIKDHPRTAYEMLRPVVFPWPLPEIVLQHHERLDGSGYPDAVKGDAIRLEARIIAVADVVEAMASHRPYRAALGIDVALAEITKQRGSQLDAPAVDACVRLFRERGYALPKQ